jgi:nucleotide-binding universal stress UspA family protein
MYKKILVPLDGSEMAETVLPHAVALARATGAEVTLVTVVQFTLGAAGGKLDAIWRPTGGAGSTASSWGVLPRRSSAVR